jgi:hypothetical protein
MPSRTIENTIWMSLNDKAVNVHTDRLDELFQKVVKKLPTDSAPSSPKRNCKPELVKLIDDKRSYNIDLSLARFKVLGALIGVFGC